MTLSFSSAYLIFMNDSFPKFNDCSNSNRLIIYFIDSSYARALNAMPVQKYYPI
jgi:hypothetical protein